MKLILVDGNSMLFRAYYATAYSGALMRSKDGTVTNAIYALANIMSKIIQDQNPDYVLVAFDTGKPTFRHLQYPEYKAGRKETPPELKSQFALAKELLKNLGIFTYEKDGFEADDIIGTVSKLGESQGMEVQVYSGDRDLLQLISSLTHVCLTKKGVTELKIMTEEVLMEELGLKPDQIRDLKGLMGDASDNIPGIAGVGEKTALKLLTEHKTLENILDADISGKLGEKIKEQKEVAKMSKELATINRDLPVDFAIEDMKYLGPHYDDLTKFYTRYDMHTLLKKIPQVNKKEEIPYEIVEKIPEECLTKYSSVIVEINGSNYHVDEVIGCAISFGDKSYFINLANLLNDDQLKHYLENEKIVKYGYDIKKEIVALHRYGIEAKGFVFDLLLGAYLLQPSLKEEPAIIYDYFDKSLPYLSQIFQRGKYVLNELAHFSCLEAKYLFDIKDEIVKKMKDEGVDKLFADIELPLAKILAKMEINGITLDLKLLKEKSDLISGKLDEIAKDIYALAGQEYNINSPVQTAKVLFDDLQLPANRKRSTSADELTLLIDRHPIIRKILEYRQYYKLKSVYLDGLPLYVLDDGKIHTIYNQALTQTGRLSSREPNLQNIAVRSAEGKEVRKAFVVEKDGWYLLSFDYSQIELRVLAHMANAKSLIDAFNSGIDVHADTAMKVFGVSKEEVTPKMRRQAKIVNFGIVYGMSDWGLAEELGIDVRSAKEFIRRYFDHYPEIQDYFKNVIEACQNSGYVKTLFGRKRYVNEIKDPNYNIREFGKRIAMNTPIQGTAADVMKMAMIKVDCALKKEKLQTKMLLQVHDELVFEVPYEELMSVIPLIQAALEDFSEFKVKLKAEYHYGYSWYEE